MIMTIFSKVKTHSDRWQNYRMFTSNINSLRLTKWTNEVVSYPSRDPSYLYKILGRTTVFPNFCAGHLPTLYSWRRRNQFMNSRSKRNLIRNSMVGGQKCQEWRHKRLNRKRSKRWRITWTKSRTRLMICSRKELTAKKT